VLAGQLARPFLVAWGLAGAAALWLVGGTESSGPVIQAVVWGSLPFGLLLWRDWSRMAPPSGRRTAAQASAVVATVLVLIVAGRSWAIDAWLMASASVAVTVLLGLWRWRQLARFPAAWPAARAR